MKKSIALLILALCCVTSLFSQTNQEEVISLPIQKVKVFPNPATSVINVLGLHNSHHAVITVSDVYGNKVLQHKWEIKNNALNIPIANLEKGIYLISIQSKEQTVQTKFYKQ